MSRHDSDVDFWDAINGPDELQATASCSDCGADIVASTNPCCDACSDQRERWADALEARQQARANLKIQRQKEIA